MAKNAFINNRGVNKLLDSMDFKSSSQRLIIRNVARKAAKNIKTEVRAR